MGRITYLAAEALFTWALLAGAQLGMLYFLTDFGPGWRMLSAALAVVTLPVALKWVLLQPDRLSAATGVYNAVRPLATLRQAGLLPSSSSERLQFGFHYLDPCGREPMDVVAQLSARLREQGVRHANAGALRVHDGSATWVVEPSLQDCTLSGWVVSDRTEHSQQVLVGIRDFLTIDMGMVVEEVGR
jgi:hypothetical protein